MLVRLLLTVSILPILCGCASINSFLATTQAKIAPRERDRQVSMSVEEMMEARDVRAGAGDHFRWMPPVVQKVTVPAMIRGGVLIPTHETYVIVNDASYVVNDDKTEAVRRKYSIPAGVEIVSPMRGSDVVVAVFRMNRVFDESTVVPIAKVAFLFHEKSPDRALALSNDEVAQIGNYLCSFSRERGADFITANVVESGLKSMKTYTISQTQMLFLSNGYVLAPLFEKGMRKGES
ncbi:MAG: hypothetical protein M0Z71_00090 [Nitrospiraceae bacterium]|nr:hypothetical protein [Nitrospiraceae bacterium]